MSHQFNLYLEHKFRCLFYNKQQCPHMTKSCGGRAPMICICYFDCKSFRLTSRRRFKQHWLFQPELLTVSDRRRVWPPLLTEGCEDWGNSDLFYKEEEEVTEKRNKMTMKSIRKLTEAFIKLNENAPYGQGAGQMNKPLKINLTNYCLSHLWVSPAWLGTQSKRADAEKSWGGRRVTTSCLGNYHHFWHELRGLLTASLLLLNSLHCWLMKKREHAPTPLMGLWHNVLCIPCDPASWAG